MGIIRGESDQQEMKELKVAEEIAKRFVAWDIDVSGQDQHLRTELARVLG